MICYDNYKIIFNLKSKCNIRIYLRYNKLNPSELSASPVSF